MELKELKLFLVICMGALVFVFTKAVLNECKDVHSTDADVDVVTRDSVVVNYTYRDSVVYNFIKKDSVVIDYTLVPATEFDTITLHDTMFIAVPIASYHFSDSIADVWTRGYRVTIDSVQVHWRESSATETIFVTPRKRWLTADVGTMLIKADAWALSADVRASIRISDKWSVDGRAGIVVGGKVHPYAGVGVRYALGARRSLGAE